MLSSREPRSQRGRPDLGPLHTHPTLIIRGGAGLGDSLYVQAVTRHYTKLTDKPICVNTNYPDVFRPLRPRVGIAPFTRKANVTAHYTTRKQNSTTQFEDCCITAGLQTAGVELKLDWVRLGEAPANVRAKTGGRPVILVAMPRSPMNRTDGFGAEVLPDCSIIHRFIDQNREPFYFVLVGAGKPLYPLPCDWDLTNQTSVCDLIDLAQDCDGMLGYVSFFVPLAESLNKPLFCVWSSRGLKVANKFVNAITPQKVFQHPSQSSFAMDDWPQEKQEERFGYFLEQVTTGALVRGKKGLFGRIWTGGLG